MLIVIEREGHNHTLSLASYRPTLGLVQTKRVPAPSLLNQITTTTVA